VPGSILSTPAIVDGYIYVGLANSIDVAEENGGTFLKIELATGATVAQFNWSINVADRDTHGFCGMGCTPAVTDTSVYFSGFDGKVYCLDNQKLELQWVTDCRYADMAHNQPVTNDFPNANNQVPPLAKASGWSSPLFVSSAGGNRLYVGIGEGENEYLYSFVYCLDADTGNVIWIYCTCQFEYYSDPSQPTNNKPNQLPLETVRQELPAGFTTFPYQPVAKGASVWSAIAYDPDLDYLYCATGNPVPDGPIVPNPPSPESNGVMGANGYTNGVLVLNGTNGEFVAYVPIPYGTSYRPSDIDVDIGGTCTLWEINGKKVVGIGCKNGCYMVFDPTTREPGNPQSFKVLATRQLLPLMNDGSQIPTVDPHGPDTGSNPNPVQPGFTNIPNWVSNLIQAENFHGTYSTAALCSPQKKLFIGVGGNNYHFICAGIDTATTPFIRALDWETLADAWPLDDSDPKKYACAADPNNPLYKIPPSNQIESGISVPAVVNDVVFMSTTAVALYAFSATDGTLLWSDTTGFGMQTGGMSGGYGYCMGPAIWGNYVVAGALVQGANGGVLNIYKLS
jgi:outer membrane protein assembly factor BamB